MDKQKLVERLMGTFVVELEEHLRSLNDQVLLLEKTAPGAEQSEVLTRLFRAAHSLKGAARSVDQREIESLCHELEEALIALRNGTEQVSADYVSAILARIDLIERAADALKHPNGEVAEPVSPEFSDHASVPTQRIGAQGSLGASDKSLAQDKSNYESAMMRVGAYKLDTLLAWSGELLVARRRISDRIPHLARLRVMLRSCRAQARQRSNVAKLTGASVTAKEHEQHRPSGNHTNAGLDRVLRQLEHEFEQIVGLMVKDSRALDQAAIPVEREIRQIRMLPFAECCDGLKRVMRDLSEVTGKQAELDIEGGEVELDRAIIEELRDPLRHLVRNAIDHGIEPPMERIAAGKPPVARVRINVRLRGAQVEISISDDGRGLDLEVIKTRLQSRGLAVSTDPVELAHAIFLPGLSTARVVTEVSGRGIGLDIVKTQVEALHGSASVSSTPGVGTTFLVTVPLTLTVMRALLLSAGGQTFAIATANVQKLIRISRSAFRWVGGREMITLGHGEAPIPIVSLGNVLGLPASMPKFDQPLLVMIVTAGELRIALIVDNFLTEQDLMIKNLGRRIRRVQLISGATLLSSGQVALVLHVGNVVHKALGAVVQYNDSAADEQPELDHRKRLVVADDSVTTLGLEKSILEAAGYEVFAAHDGEAAWQMLQTNQVDLLVSDVDMPNLDGFGLTAAIRSSERFRDLPVVLVTARENDADKVRGLELGANAYLTKSAFDQTHLLETVAQLL
jgi:two-component system chemotaxis sensor kinase CheA